MSVEMTPRARAKREQIRGAARRLFLDHGFEATTMDAVTAAAGVSKQTLYRYYAGKEALFADILDDLTLRQRGERDWPPSGLFGVATVAELTAALTWVARDVVADTLRPELIALLRVLIAEAPRFPHLRDLFHATVSGPGYAAVTDLLEQARAAGVVVVPETAAAARLFLGALLTYSQLDAFFAAGAPQAPTDGEIQTLVRLFVRAVT